MLRTAEEIAQSQNIMLMDSENVTNFVSIKRSRTCSRTKLRNFILNFFTLIKQGRAPYEKKKRRTPRYNE